MREHRHPRLALHALDQALAAARHDHVERAAEAASISPTASREANGAREIAASGRPALARPSTRQAWIAAASGSCPSRRAAPPRCREAQGAGVGGDVRPALVDHADDADRRATR